MQAGREREGLQGIVVVLIWRPLAKSQNEMRLGNGMV